MKVSRRDFLKISAGAGAAATFINKEILEQAFALITQNTNATNLVWLNGQACSGCSISVLQFAGNVGGTYYTNLVQLLGALGVDIEFMETIMPQAGAYFSADGENYSIYTTAEVGGHGPPGAEPIDEMYVDAMEYLERVLNSAETNIVIVEGAIPYERWADYEDVGFCEWGMKDQGSGTYVEGKMWQFADLIKHVHEKSSVPFFIAFGNCGGFGGIPGGNPNPTGAKGLMHFLEDAATSDQFGWISQGGNPGGLPAPSGLHKLVINLQGCPAKPEHLVLVYAAFVAGGTAYIKLDRWYRPTQVTLDGSTWIDLHSYQVHDRCERKRAFDAGNFAFSFEEAIDDPEKCLLKIGCRGVDSWIDCSAKGSFVASGPANGWNPNGVGSWNMDRDNPIAGEVNPGMWCVAAGSPCYGCSTTTFPDNVLGRSFFIECTHSEMLDACELPGPCSAAPELQGLTCYTCHSVTMPRQYKKWISDPPYGYGYSYGPYYP